jgi:hypothetical protein
LINNFYLGMARQHYVFSKEGMKVLWVLLISGHPLSSEDLLNGPALYAFTPTGDGSEERP